MPGYSKMVKASPFCRIAIKLPTLQKLRHEEQVTRCRSLFVYASCTIARICQTDHFPAQCPPSQGLTFLLKSEKTENVKNKT